MDLIDVQPKEFMFMYGVTLTDLKKFRLILDNMQFNYDGNNKDHVAAKKYLEEKLYPSIKEGLKSVEDYNGS